MTRPTDNNFNKERTELNTLFNWARKRNLVPFNPVSVIERIGYRPAKKPIWTPQEFTRLLLAAGPERPFILTLVHTLARVDEIHRLKWTDVNFERRMVRLSSRKGRGSGWEEDWIGMNEDLYQILWGLWQKADSPRESDYVFTNPKTGNRYGYRYKLFRGICRRANVPNYGYHSIRRFVASYLYDKEKVSLPVVSRLLRHKNLQTTERYLQAIEPRYREAIALLEKSPFSNNALMDALTEEEIPADR